MKISNDRLSHSLAVARRMKEIVELNKEKFNISNDDAFILGFLHDVGYEFCDKQEDHESTGGVLLKSQGYKFWTEVYYHGKNQNEYNSMELDLLNYVDMTTSIKGEFISIEERILDIGERYGLESVQYTDAVVMREKILIFANQYNLDI